MTDAATDALELRQILYWRWDPIGVSDEFPLNAGEYDLYWFRCRDLPRSEARRPVLDC